MKKIFTFVSSILAYLMIVSLVSACTSPTLYNKYGTPINIFFGEETITYSDYPPEATVVNYIFSIKNNDDQGLNLTITPSSDLLNYVWESTYTLGANEQKEENLLVNIAGNDKIGEIYVTGLCDDGLPIGEGTIRLFIDGRGDSTQNCKGTKNSCGLPGQCQNLYDLDGCYDGKKREYYCLSNQPKYTSSCTSYCCNLIGGTCRSGECDVPHYSINLALNVTNLNGQPNSGIIKLYEPGTSRVANTSTINGYGIIASPNATVDFNLEYNSSILNILVRNLDLEELSNTLQITLNDVSTSIPNVTLIKAYYISTSLSPIDGTLKFKYSGLSYGNEQGLFIYKCSSFNTTSSTCNGTWVKQDMTKNTVDDIASTEITSFSVYALGESQITTTTTTTATTTTTTGSSSDGNNDDGNRYSGSSGRSTTTTRPTTTITQCTCDSWSNSGCGISPCDQTQMKQQRTCNPSGCNIESQCVVDDSCTTIQGVNETENQITSKQPTGLFVLPDLSQYIYPISGIIILTGAGIAVWKLNGRIRGIFPSYKFSSSRSSKKGHVTVNVESPKYLEVKVKEKTKEVTKPVEQPRVNIEARNKSIEEMRNRALEMDKKIKRK
jgi:hypothetical protein